MKIVDIRTFLVDAGWRPWAFVRVDTDEGISGYGECTCIFTQYSVLGAIEDMKPILLGTDPRAYEMRFWDMYRRARLGSMGGAVSKAIGGLECALIDIKAKALGISVAELFGGPLRETIPLYFSHFLTTRAMTGEFIGTKPLRSWSDIDEAAREAVAQGFKALKTNIVVPGDPAKLHFDGFGGGPGTTDQYVTVSMLRDIDTQFRTIREAVGPDIGIILDLNFNFKPESCIRIAQVLKPYDLLWIELDMFHPDSLVHIKQAVDVPLCSGENFFYMEGYQPYFEKRAADIIMVDTIWNGFAQAKKVGDLAQLYQMNVCPHNYYSHLSTFICANLCAVLPNVRIMEYEGEDIPWRDDFVTQPPEIVNGEMRVPSGPGWGTELNEKEMIRRAWGNKGGRRVVTVPSGFEPLPAGQLAAAASPELQHEEQQMLRRTAYDGMMGPWAGQAAGQRSTDMSAAPAHALPTGKES